MAFPLIHGPDEAFALVRGFLKDAGYTEQFLLDRFGLPNLGFLLYPLGKQGDEFRARYQGPGTAALLARLLMGGYAVTREELAANVPEAVIAALESLGLLRGAPDGSGRLCTPVIAYPAYGFLIASDRGFYLEGWPGYRDTDYVMSGTEHICRDYVNSLPSTPCERFLEIGAGSGLASLVMSRYAGHVWATDITERAVAYTEFNRRLNGIANITVLCGDLFAPVEGLSFDRIASNPPFEPPLKKANIFSVGGEDGEAIMQRLVAAVPRYLSPGGRLYMQAIGTDRETGNFDERARSWLGEAGAHCDSAFFVHQTMQPREYAIQQILGENSDSWQLEDWNLFYRKLRAGSVVHGHWVVQRCEQARPVFHTRRNFGPRSTQADMEWLLDWETRCSSPGFAERALAARPMAGEGWELVVRHAMDSGRLAPRSYSLKTQNPFTVETQVRPWIAAMLARCDGNRSGAELLEWVRSNGELQSADGEAEFVRTLAALGSCRFVSQI